MTDYSKAHIKHLIIHKTGNKSADEGVSLSNREPELQDELIEELLLKFFTASFKDNIFRQFTHTDHLNLNEMYNYCEEMFSDSSQFIALSQKMANHLYRWSEHPNIKSGEFYVVYLKDCLIDDELVDAVGVFKTESKDTYLKIREKESHLIPDYEEGINLKKLDKGALIFNTEKNDGYVIKVTDATNKQNEARYWTEDFLCVKPREDDYYHTDAYLQLCKSFADEALDDIEQEDRIALKNDTLQYFKTKDNFSVDDYETEVIANETVSERFREYRDDYAESRAMAFADSFNIEPAAVSKAKNKYKSVLKLDKNFHVYVHGNRRNLEKGYDEERGQYFYKLFFDEEM